MIRDLRLLPAALVGWLGVLLTLRLGRGLGAVVVLVALVVAAAALPRLRRSPGGRHRRRTVGRAAATMLLSGIVVAALGGWTGVRAEMRAGAVEPHLREVVVADLRVDADPRSLGDDRVLVLATWLAPIRAPVPVTVLADGDAWTSVVVGSVVRAEVRVSATDPGDAAAALLVTSETPELLARPPPLAGAVAALRAGLLAACAGLDPQARGLVPGIAIGDDRALPATLENDLRTVSLTHVTAVSGAHVAMVLGLVMAATTRLRRPWRAAVGGIVLTGLVLLVHPSASVVRSAAMGAVLLVGLLLSRPRAALPALWTSVLVLLAVDPWLSTSFGFVLSVLATAGLLLASGPLTDRLGRVLPRPLAMALAVPIAAQIACLPALALLQPEAPMHGVLANMLAAPAVPPATVLGLAATLVHPAAPTLASLLAGCAGVATAWIAAVATWCARLPFATVPWWTVVVALLALAGGVVALPVARRAAGRRRGDGLSAR